MSGDRVGSTHASSAQATRFVTLGLYVLLGLLLLVTRAIGLERSYWHDEIVTARDFVHGGPHAILVGPYLPNNHQLFSLLSWATTSVVGESELVVRLWSIVPFAAGVFAVVWWLDRRVSPSSAVVFLFLATVSPLLLDITRQARGYGLAFYAMCAVIVAALEVLFRDQDRLLVAFFAAGVIGTWTLPHFGIAFLAIALTLLARPRVRARIAGGLMAWTVLVISWYAPHIGELSSASRQQYGVEIGTPWMVTSPIDQIVIPSLIWIDGVVVFSGVKWVPVVALIVALMLPSPLLRDPWPALVLWIGPVATVVVLWLTETREVPRFLSFLTVPLFVLMATGIGETIDRLRHARAAPLTTVLSFATLGLLALGFVRTGVDVLRFPREAHKDAAAAIDGETPEARVFADVLYPGDLEYYLGRPLVRRPFDAEEPCARREVTAVVVQPWVIHPTEPNCLDRAGTRRYRLRQYARGGMIDVWLIPPAPG